VVGDWQSYPPTLTGFGTPTSVAFYYRQVGSNLEVRGSFNSGVSTATEARISFPSGLTATSQLNDPQPLGVYFQNKGAATQKGGAVFCEGSRAYMTFGNYGVFGTTAVSALAKANGENVVENGDTVRLFVSVPIAEWAGSGTINLLGDEVINANERASYQNGAAPTIAAGTNTILWPTANISSPNMNSATGVYTVPAKGEYLVTLNLTLETGSPDAWAIIRHNSTNKTTSWFGYGAARSTASSSVIIDAVKGDTITAQIQNNSGGSYTLRAAAISNVIDIMRISDYSAGEPVGFGLATGTNSGLLPPVTSMGDVLATQLGYKQYLHGTTYNGGNAPTVASAGATIVRGVFIPYLTQGGTWRLRFTFNFTMSTATRTNLSTTINGVTFKNVANYLQAVTVNSAPGSAQNAYQGFTLPNTSTVEIYHSSFSTGGYGVSGDVELESKPTWAY
jgi:hypothetical protein